jgi:hypothetical protein
MFPSERQPAVPALAAATFRAQQRGGERLGREPRPGPRHAHEEVGVHRGHHRRPQLRHRRRLADDPVEDAHQPSLPDTAAHTSAATSSTEPRPSTTTHPSAAASSR